MERKEQSPPDGPPQAAKGEDDQSSEEKRAMVALARILGAGPLVGGSLRLLEQLADYVHTVLRPRIICLKKVHPGKRARAQELYIVSSYTYAFNETFTCVWIFLWSVSLEWQEAHLDDGFTQTIPPPASPQIFK